MRLAVASALLALAYYFSKFIERRPRT